MPDCEHEVVFLDYDERRFLCHRLGCREEVPAKNMHSYVGLEPSHATYDYRGKRRLFYVARTSLNGEGNYAGQLFLFSPGESIGLLAVAND